MKVLFRDIRAGKRRAAITDLKSTAEAEIRKVIDDWVKPNLIEEHEEIVKEWRHKPGFSARTYITAKKIEVSVFPTGEHKKIWTYVDQGTKPHTITPKTKRVLHFTAGRYVPKTLANPARVVLGGGYVANPEPVFTKLVRHPGSKAREFSKQIAEDFEPLFKDKIEETFRRIAQEMSE